MSKREEMARAACKVAEMDPDEALEGVPRWQYYLPVVDAICEVYEADDD